MVDASPTQLAPGSKKAPQRNPSALTVNALTEEDRCEAVSKAALRPSVQAALTLARYNKIFGELSIDTLVSELITQAKAVSEGDLKRAESMLMSQAHTLDAIFNHLAQRAINAEYMDHFDRYLRLALKAQSQCRTTLETLSVIKNPPNPAFIRQQNVAVNQQVNNGYHPDPCNFAG